MALFDQYNAPGVLVTESVEGAGTNVTGSARIAVLIGEGQETKSYVGTALHRGSSSQADEQVVSENLTAQVTGVTRSFQLNYWPVAKGDGNGTITNNPLDIQVYVNGSPVSVSSLVGATGAFQTLSYVPAGSDLVASYYFKRSDTHFTDEDLSLQVPSFASLSTQSGYLTLAPAIPGDLANDITVAFTLSATGVSDALAVSGIGTDVISVELKKVGGTTRTVQEVANVLNAGVITLSGGALTATVVSNGSSTASAASAANFSGGNGPNTNTVFRVHNSPIVDGTNGGVITNSTANVTVKVNGNAVVVSAVDGLNGLITLASPVVFGSTLTASYYTNTYQDTSDVLPGLNITSLDAVGYGVSRSDFIDGTDFVLELNSQGAQIQWGSSTNTQAGVTALGYSDFNAVQITTTLVPEKVYMRPVTGTVNGRNYTFTLEDVPVEGLKPTHDPSHIQVYVGATPALALAGGAVRVTSLNGNTGVFSLYNPPAGGNLVFASYYRSTLNDNSYTLSVVAPGVTGQGTYKIQNESGEYAPVAAEGDSVIAAAAFETTGIVWPSAFSDLKGVPGATASETITLTFQDDGLTAITTPSVQASNIVAVTGLRFRATTPGTGPNNVTTVTLTNAGGPTADASAVTVASEDISIEILNGSSGTRTLQDVINLFTNGNSGAGYSTTAAGRIIVEATSGSVVLTDPVSTHVSSPFLNGAAAILTPYSNRFRVTSSRTDSDVLADGYAKTGGATTPLTENVGSGAVGAVGYIGQTYIDANTGVQFTIVDPASALDYGYTSLPSPSYRFTPKINTDAPDTLVFTMSTSASRTTSASNNVAIPGLLTKVTSTYGTQAGETAIVRTFNKSGNEPSIGTFYYVDFTTSKTASDFDLKIFTSLEDVYAEYGQPTPTNKLSLAAQLFLINGGQIFGCIQVPKQVGLETAGDTSFISAIQSLSQPLPGSDKKANLIVPLSTSTVVHQALNRHLLTQSSATMEGPAIGYVGYNEYAQVNDVRAAVRSLVSDRMIAVYPGAALMDIDVSGRTSEFLITGEFLAAAMAGLDVNPALDTATSLTRKMLVGPKRLISRVDSAIMNLAAADGVSWLVEKSGALMIRHHVTTDTSSPLKREPTNRKVADEVRLNLADNLEQYIARKSLTSLINDITGTVNAVLKSMVERELVAAFKDIVVRIDEFDSTIAHVSLKFKPVSSILWLDVNLKVTTQL